MTQLLPNGKQQFVDINGNPLVGGSVYHYAVGTSTPKDTFQDFTLTILNTNPVICDARGQAGIYGSGNYRQVLRDALGNQIWDQVVVDAGASAQAATDTLRADLALNSDPLKGSTLVGYSGRTVYARLQGDRHLNDGGVIGDGSTDNTASINVELAAAANQDSRYVEPGIYKVSGRPTNINGIQLKGPGAIVTSVTGGYQQWNSYANNEKIEYRRENLGRFYSVLKNTTRQINCFLYGDSTVQGGFNFLSGPYFLDYMLPIMGKTNGLQQPLIVTNRGVGGTKISDMNAIPDVTATADIFFIKYGINDGTNPLATRLATFRDNLRSQLASIRAQTYGSVSNLSIVLVGPNSTFDTIGQRDAFWYEQLRGIYLQCADEFQCAYYDTYALLQDSSTASAQGWLDDTVLPGSGRGVHPTDIGNPWIWGRIMDWVCGGSQLYGKNTNNFINTGGVYPFANLALLPNQYQRGITIERARVADGWPEEGAVITSMQADFIGMQQLFPFANNRTKVYVRNCYTVGNYWNLWTGSLQSLVFAASWVAFGAPWETPGSVLSASGVVTLSGSIKGGTTTAGVTFATLPAGMRPVLQCDFVVSTNSGTARIVIFPDGSMQGLTVLDATRTSLGGIAFRAA